MDRQPNRRPVNSLGLWLSLLGLLFVTAMIFVADTKNEATPHLQVKTAGRPVILPSRTDSTRLKTQSAVPKLIRVNLTPAPTRSIELEVRSAYSIRSIDTGHDIGSGERIALSSVRGTSEGLKVGSTTYQAVSLEIIPRQSPVVRVNDHLYRGSVRLYRRKDGSITAVNVLPLEEYLASVVDSEMPAKFPEAARQAQAIVSRTYALYQIQHADPAAIYDVFASQRSQKYLGVEYTDAGRRLAGESESSRKIVVATKGLVCKHRGDLFCTYYSAVCGGCTTQGAEVFPDACVALKSVPCEWCRESEYFRWTANVAQADLQKSVQLPGKSGRVLSIQQTAGPGGGVISRFQLSDGKTTVTASGVDLRDRLPPTSLRSPHFSLTLTKDGIRAQGRGHGHGVGLCQWGARGQALDGKSAEEIVRYYYPGAQVASVDE